MQFNCDELLSNIVTKRLFDVPAMERDLTSFDQLSAKLWSDDSVNEILPTKELIDLADKITKELTFLFKYSGLNAKVAWVPFDEEHLTLLIPQIIIDLNISQTQFHSVEFLKRIFRPLGITTIVVDPITLRFLDSMANFEIGSVHMNTDLVLDLLSEKSPSADLIHELNHGRFEYKRVNGISSIYATGVIGDLGKIAPSISSAYSNGVTFEELYTYGRELHNWAQKLPMEFSSKEIVDNARLEKFLYTFDLFKDNATALKEIASYIIVEMKKFVESRDILLYSRIIPMEDDLRQQDTIFFAFDKATMNFHFDNSNEAVYENYSEKLLLLQNFMEIHGVTGDRYQKFLEKSRGVIKLKTKSESEQAKILFEEALKAEKLILQNKIDDLERFDAVAGRLLVKASQINEEHELLVSIYQVLQNQESADGVMLFNELYKKMRVHYREITNLLKEADK